MSRKMRFGLLLIFLITSSAGVELQREGTEQWVTINVESVVGVGDRIRTGESGSATLSFINEDSYVTLGPDTLVRIDRLEETADGYSIAYNVVQGKTEQVLISPEDKPATFEVTSLGLQLMTRGGQFALELGDILPRLKAGASGVKQDSPPKRVLLSLSQYTSMPRRKEYLGLRYDRAQ